MINWSLFWHAWFVGFINWFLGMLWGYYVGRQSGRRAAEEEMRTKPIADDPEVCP